MPGAGSASFSARARADTILGIRRPRGAAHRLTRAEPWLRYAVPAILATFLISLAVAFAFHQGSERETATRNALDDVAIAARLAAGALGNEKPDAARLRQLLPSEQARGRRIIVVDETDQILAAQPPLTRTVGTLTSYLGDDQPIGILGERVGAMKLTLADGEDAVVAVHRLPDGKGQVAVVQSLAEVHSGWWLQTRYHALLLASAGFVIVGTGLAYGLQTRRALDADRVCEQVRHRLDAALGRGRCGLWDWDIARGTIFWSDSMYAMLGYDPRDALLSFGDVNALVHPEDGDLYALARQLADDPSSVDHEFRIRGAGDAWVWLRTRAEIVSDTIDGGRHLVGIAVDVTEQRRLAESTAAADMRLRDAVEAISEAFVLWDESNRLVLCNSKFRDLHALSDDDASPGRRYQEIMGRGVLPPIRRELPAAGRPSATARTFEVELTDGRWLQVSERRTHDGGYVSVGTDITTLKRHQERLTVSERELIETVKDLKTSRRELEVQTQQLAELAESHLDQRARAESANQAKSEFLANMSHELRTPLNAIMGFADLMQSEVFGSLGSPRYGEYCRDILKSGGNLLLLIDDILHMARIEAKRVTLASREMVALPAVERAVRAVTDEARAKSIAVEVSLPPDLKFFADEHAFQQILGNLLNNAVKFTPAGGRVSVRGKSCGGFAHLFVEDTGIGIPKTALAKLGRPFEQVEGNLTRSHKGSGLGLAIARSTAELHGGSLRIRSEETVGTIVLLRLPVAPPEPPAALSTSEARRGTVESIRAAAGALPRPGNRRNAEAA